MTMPRSPAYALARLFSRQMGRNYLVAHPKCPPLRRQFHGGRCCLSKQGINLSGVVPKGEKKIEIVKKSGEKIKISLLWLRDHCHCQLCENRDTMQRSFDSFSVLYDRGAQFSTDEHSLTVKWDDGHVGEYSWEWLLNQQEERRSNIKRTYWGSEIKDHPPSVHYDEIMANDDGVGKWTAKILEYGLCFVEGCPISPEKTQQLLERIAFIRITHYGKSTPYSARPKLILQGGFYDFTSDLTMKDTAYTSLALPAHTDNTYFTDPSGLQAFHLLSHTSGSGGASLLVDGFYCAKQLLKIDSQAFKILSSVPILWHASGNKGITITPARKFPVLNFNQDVPGEDELMQLRWNNDDRATIPMYPAPGVKISEWYDAARLFSEIVKERKNEYWEQLRPGRPLIFDNWRVMHGRSAFTGKRRMCGAYINHDDFMSRYWNTNFTREEILKRIL